MSYILDALRKAEHEHHLGQPPNPVASSPPAQPSRPRLWVWLLLGLGLLFNAALLAFLLTRSQPEPLADATAPSAPREPAAPSPAPAPSRTRPVLPTPPPTTRKGPVSKPEPPEPSRSSVTAGLERRQETPPKPAPARSVTLGPEPPPLLDALPAGARRGLPALNLDVHVYSPDAGKRFVIINGRRYREGERLGEGPLLETVTANGVVLRQGSQRFQLSVRR